MEDLIIKCASAEDIEALCEFERQARITEPDIWLTEFEVEQYKKGLKGIGLDNLANSKIIIAKQGDKVIGRCDIAIILSLMDFYKTGYVDWIYTLIHHRGRGIGKRMLRGAEEYMKSQDVNNYYLFTASNPQAVEFYHRQRDLNFSMKEVAEKEIE